MDRSIALALHTANDDAAAAGAPALATATLDTHFGRARAFLLVAPDGEDPEVLANGDAGAAHGAGTAAAGLLARHGVRTVIAADFGPIAHRALQAARIEAWKAPAGTPLEECLRRLRAGELEPMTLDVYP